MDKKKGDGGLTVLVVDDDPIQRRVTCSVVRKCGHSCEAVEGGEAALHAVARRRFDVVIMDLHMPGMDGVAATRELLRQSPADQRPVVIALSGNEHADDRNRFLAAGAHTYLSKPLDSAALRAVLASLPAAQ